MENTQTASTVITTLSGGGSAILTAPTTKSISSELSEKNQIHYYYFQDIIWEQEDYTFTIVKNLLPYNIVHPDSDLEKAYIHHLDGLYYTITKQSRKNFHDAFPDDDIGSFNDENSYIAICEKLFSDVQKGVDDLINFKFSSDDPETSKQQHMKLNLSFYDLFVKFVVYIQTGIKYYYFLFDNVDAGYYKITV